MRHTWTLLLFAALTISISKGVEAQTVRTWVSATSGADTNPCSRALPCRNFAAAIAAVSPGGEVVVLDSGGYGAVIISKSVALISPAGIHAAIAPTSGTAVAVTSGSTLVILRSLYLNGKGAAIGVHHSAAGASLHVESSVIAGFTGDGINATQNLFVSNTIVRNCGGVAVRIDGASTASVIDSLLQGNLRGLDATNASVFARNTVAAENAEQGFVVRFSSAAPADRMVVESCLAQKNNDGFVAIGPQAVLAASYCTASQNLNHGFYASTPPAAQPSFVRIYQCTSTQNVNGGLVWDADAKLQSAGNNFVKANGFDLWGVVETFALR